MSDMSIQPGIDDVVNNYMFISANLRYVYKKLYTKLRNNGIKVLNTDHTSFTSLIHNIDRIPAIERYYPHNIKPADEVSMNIDSSKDISYEEFNVQLAKKINFYMRLMGYYLALKGVPIDDINNATSLNARIDLIDKIDKILLSIFVVSLPEKNYYGRPIVIDYVLKDLNNEEITDGIITVYYKDKNTILKRINVGEELIISPPAIGQDTYIFEFTGSQKHKATRVIKNINVLNPNIVSMLFIDDDNSILNTNGDLELNYITTDTDENVPAIIDMDIYIDENNDALLMYTVDNVNGNFDTLNQGLVNVDFYAGDLYCEFVDLKTLDN